jgi:hypothetical protein
MLIIVQCLFLSYMREGFSAKPNFPNLKFELGQEKRSLICTGAGYSFTAKSTPTEEGRRMASDSAKRLILRKTEEFIRHRLSGKEDKIRFEFTEIHPGEYVDILEQKEIKQPFRNQDQSYGMQIIAEVQYRLILSPDIQNELLSDSQLPLTVRIRSDKPAYRSGEKIVFYVKSNRDCFSRVIDIEPNAAMIQLWPNLYRKSYLLKAQETYLIPDPGQKRVSLDVAPPFGKATIYVLASEMKLNQKECSKYMEDFGIIKGFGKDFIHEIKQLAGKSRFSSNQPGTFSCAEFFEDKWVIQTSKK